MHVSFKNFLNYFTKRSFSGKQGVKNQWITHTVDAYYFLICGLNTSIDHCNFLQHCKRTQFVLIHAPFSLLMKQAESLSVKMPVLQSDVKVSGFFRLQYVIMTCKCSVPKDSKSAEQSMLHCRLNTDFVGTNDF